MSNDDGTPPNDPVSAGRDQEPERRPNGTFAPGTSGNPSGRPKGSRARVLEALDEVAEDAAGGIVAALATRAQAGDPQAAALVLARVWPARKGRSLVLPELAQAGTTAEGFAALIAAMAEGIITPEEAGAVGAVLTARQQAVEVADLAARLEALEAAHSDASEPSP